MFYQAISYSPFKHIYKQIPLDVCSFKIENGSRTDRRKSIYRILSESIDKNISNERYLWRPLTEFPIRKHPFTGAFELKYLTKALWRLNTIKDLARTLLIKISRD